MPTEAANPLRFVRCPKCQRLLAKAGPERISIKSGDGGVEVYGKPIAVLTCARCGQNTTVAP